MNEEQRQEWCCCIAMLKVLSMFLLVFVWCTNNILVEYLKYCVMDYYVYILSSNFSNRCLAGTVQYDWMAQGSFDERRNSYDNI